MCIEPNVTPPPLWSVWFAEWRYIHLPRLAREPDNKNNHDPTPTPTATNTPTPTSTPTVTPTPTATPISCYNPCPAMQLRVEYPVGTFKYNVPFAQAPQMPSGSLFRMYTGNETKMNFPVAGPSTVKIYCAAGTNDITSKCSDGACKFGAPICFIARPNAP